jgi:hypothetical protein
MEKKAFNVDTMDFVPTTPPASESKNDAPDADAADEAAAQAKLKEEADSKAAEEAAAGKKDGDDADPDKKKDDKSDEEEVIGEDEFIKERYNEKYKIDSAEKLDEHLELIPVMAEKIKKLEAEASKPKFETEEHEKLFNFIKDMGYDSTKFPEAIQTYARVISMDVEKADPRILLEEEYILTHTEFTREEAQRKFNKIYTQKYGPLDQKDFESEEAFKEAEEDRKLDLKGDKAKAAKFLAEKQKEFKANPIKKEVEEPQENELISKAIAKSAKEFGAHLGKFKELVFSPTDSEDDDFPVKFEEAELTQIRAVVDKWVKNPASYDKDGKLLFSSDPEEMTKRAAFMLFGESIIAKNYEHAQKITAAARIEDLAKVSPDRKSKTGSSVPAALSEDEQLEKLLELKTKKNGQKKPAMA